MVEGTSGSAEGRLVLLGTPHAEVDGQVITISHRKPLALLAYLGVTRRVHSREALATLLWPEADTSRAYAYLRNALWQISRTPLAPWLTVEQESIALADETWVDVHQMEAHLTAVRAHAHPPESVCGDCVTRLSEIVSLYHGDFMAGFSLGDSPDFEEWQFFQAEHLRHDTMQVLEMLTRHHSRHGEFDAALTAARRWVELDALHEPAQRALMTLYAQAGQRAAALHQYDGLLRNLRAARLEPSPETVSLYRRIRAGEIREEKPQVVSEAVPAAVPAPARRALPAQTTTFVGREAELAELYELLTLPECRLITLTGPGGIGKTRLALQAASEQTAAFADGIVFIPFVSVTGADAIIASIAEALGAQFYPQSSISPREQLLAYLSDKQLLLVPDNLEHLLDHVELWADILDRAPRIKLLATSRERLNTRGEWVVELQGLSLPHDDDDAQLSDAAILFIETAQRISAAFTPDSGEVQAISRICRLVEGIPLGIELAAAWTKTLSCAEIADEVAASLDFLTLALRDLPERHQSLRAVFARSWGLLSEADRRTFRALAVFHGGFTREAARAVTGADPSAPSNLIDKSLLRRTTEGRYEMLEVLRQYAEEQLHAVAGEVELVRDRHASHYLDLLVRCGEAIKGNPPPRSALASERHVDQAEALDMLQRDFANVQIAWRWTGERGRAADIGDAAIGLALFCEIRGRFREGAALFREALTALQAGADASQPRLSALLLAIQGQFLCRFGHIAEGCVLLEEAHAILSAGPQDAWCALGLVLSAYIGMALPHEERRRRLEAGLRIFTDLDDGWGIALTQETLGEYLSHVGESATAEPLLRESVARRRIVGDLWGTAMSLHALGVNAIHLAKPQEAAQHLMESLALREQIGDLRGVANLRTVLGNWLAYRGELEEAQQHFRESITGFHEVGDEGAVVQALTFIGGIARSRGELGEAKSTLLAALERQRALGPEKRMVAILRELGRVSLDAGETAQARGYYEECRLLLRRFDDADGLAALEDDLARLQQQEAAGE